MFESAADYLGRNMQEGIKGATINAIASSMPEFLSTVFFLFYIKDVNGFSGGIGITAGSAIYNLVAIPALVIIVVFIKKPKFKIKINKAVSIRDGGFLILTTALLIYVLNLDVINWFSGFILLVAYLIYLGYLFYRNKKSRNVASENKQHTHKSIFNSKKAWLLLAYSLFIMTFGTWILVQATEWLGAEQYKVPYLGYFNGLNIPILFVALILSAAASSVPDTIISIKDANKGNYEDAFSNAIGSNIFNISFALGVPLLLYSIIFDPIVMDPQIIELSLGIWEILLFLSIIALLVFIVGKHINIIKAVILLLLYLFFVLIIIGIITDNEIALNIFKSVTSLI